MTNKQYRVLMTVVIIGVTIAVIVMSFIIFSVFQHPQAYPVYVVNTPSGFVHCPAWLKTVQEMENCRNAHP